MSTHFTPMVNIYVQCSLCGCIQPADSVVTTPDGHVCAVHQDHPDIGPYDLDADPAQSEH